MSVNAQNVKIITIDGQVTRADRSTPPRKTLIREMGWEHALRDVDNQLEVQPTLSRQVIQATKKTKKHKKK